MCQHWMSTPLFEFEFIVEPYLSGVRVDTFLARHLRNHHAWRLHRMVVAGCVQVNDLTAGPGQRVYPGQVVRIDLVEPPDRDLSRNVETDVSIPIHYEDPWIVVVDKPMGVVTHPVGDFHSGTLIEALQQHFDSQTLAPGLLRPGVMHRLDRMTSGLLVVAKEHVSHRTLADDFEESRIQKRYLALIEGAPDFEQKRIELPIGQLPGGRSVLMSAKPSALRPRSARTDVTVRQRFGRYTLVECELHTGRNHQIRVHLSEIGFPVLGDEFYGPHGQIRSGPRAPGEQPTSERHALHACFLEFTHPILQTPLTFQSLPGDDFWQLAETQAASPDVRSAAT